MWSVRPTQTRWEVLYTRLTTRLANEPLFAIALAALAGLAAILLTCSTIQTVRARRLRRRIESDESAVREEPRAAARGRKKIK